MKKIYKTCTFVLSMLMLCAACFIIPASAAPVSNGTGVYLKTSSATVESGDTVTVEVIGKSGVSFTNIEFQLTYNTDVFALEYDASKWGTNYSGTDVGVLADDFAVLNTATAGTVKFAYATYPSKNISNDCAFLKLVLKVKDGLVKAGKTSGSVGLSVTNYKNNGTAVYTTAVPDATLNFSVTHTCVCTGDWVVTEEATCAKLGHAVKKCDLCNKVIEEKDLAKLDHKYVLDSKASTEATCTAAGNKHYACSVCGAVYDEPVLALGHDFSEWTAVKDKPNWYSSVCANCNEEKLSFAPASLEGQGIKATFDKGVFFNDVKLTTSEITPDVKTKIESKIPAGYKVIKMTDVSFVDGTTKVQPADGKLVSIAMDASFTNPQNVKVLHYKDDGTLEELTIKSVDANGIAFYASHLSPIILAEKTDNTTVTSPSTPVVTTPDPVVAPTGDNTNIWLVMSVILASAFVLIAVCRKKA